MLEGELSRRFWAECRCGREPWLAPLLEAARNRSAISAASGLAVSGLPELVHPLHRLLALVEALMRPPSQGRVAGKWRGSTSNPKALAGDNTGGQG